jgi:hypothetical protein
MSLLGSVTKQPIEVIDYDVDYTDWLTPGDGIASVDVQISPTGLTMPKPPNVSSPVVKVWTSGGVNGTTYKVTVTAITDDDRTKQDEFKVRVKET